MDKDENIAILAVPGPQPVVLTEEQWEHVQEKIRKKKLTREARGAVAERVKPLLGKPGKKDE